MTKHRYNKAKRDMAKGTLRTLGHAFSLTIADNIANMSNLPTSKGYRLSPNPKTSHVCHIHFSPLAPVPKNTREMLFPLGNPNHSLTDKQLKTKYRVQDQELYNIDLSDNKTDKRAMRKVSKGGAKEKWKEVGRP